MTLAVASAVSVASPSIASAQPHDPVCGLIEQYKRTAAAFRAALKRQDEADMHFFAERKKIEEWLKPENRDPKAFAELLAIIRKEKPDASEADAVRLARRVFENEAAEAIGRAEAYKNCSEAGHANAQALIALARTVPTSHEGALAMLALFREEESVEAYNTIDTEDDDEPLAYRLLLDSLEQFIRNKVAN